ncbi:MAG: pantoate--beta-alanine ligase [bacterium]
MQIFEKINAISSYLSRQKKAGKTIGFVPTMGALHQGHLQLMHRAKKENKLLVVSIFVNPIQFNNPEDLQKYPRELERDKELLREVGCDVLFIPEVKEMYPEGEVLVKYDFGGLDKVMEGTFRKGHFNGVAVVVRKLFEITMPDRSYFGEKDFQQLAIIQKLAEIEQLPVEIVPCAIVREPDGLAMSSRNERLTEEERNMAPFIYNCLQEAKKKKDTHSPMEIIEWVVNRFDDQPAFRLEYFQLADDHNLQPVEKWDEAKGIIAFIAAWLGNVRLIDNLRFI